MTQSSTHPLVSVVIPHYAGTEILSECLTSLNNCSYPNLEIIVVDNASPDDSVYFIKSNFQNVILIQSEYNRGFAGGCNFGAKASESDFLFFLNDDTSIDTSCIGELIDKIQNNIVLLSVHR